MTVTKRSGEVVPRDLDKFHQMIEWACEGLANVSPSEIEINASLQFTDKMKTSDIHKITIKSAADLISARYPNYQYVAAKLLLMEIRKEVFGQFEPKSLLETVKKNIKDGYYENLFEYFTEDEINYFDSKINHNKDFNYTYDGLRTCLDSYTIKDSKQTPMESPQQINMLVSMTMFKFEKDPILRKKIIVEYYNDVSDFKISLPSPFMSGLRTTVKGYASCCLIDAGDSRESLTAANSASIIMSTLRAGIGIFTGDIRGIGSWVRNSIKHLGIVSMLKWFESAVKAFSQPSKK
jgi:ribonucleoside-diphosphate reductase alpha chain